MSERLAPTLARAPVECYIDMRELAVALGISVSTVKRFVAEGMPSETWGMARTRRFLLSQCVLWAAERARRRAGTIATCRDRDFDAPDQPQPKE